jgi:hypothetical protein
MRVPRAGYGGDLDAARADLALVTATPKVEHDPHLAADLFTRLAAFAAWKHRARSPRRHLVPAADRTRRQPVSGQHDPSGFDSELQAPKTASI